ASAVRVRLDAGAAHPALREQRTLLAAMTLGRCGAPATTPSSRPLVDDGSIRLFPDFATQAECAHLATGLRDLLAPAVVVDSTTGATIRHPVRNADEAAFGPTREDLAVRAINLRLAAASGTEVAQGEALTVLRYAPGQQFKLHSDVIGRTRNERVATMLVYLNDAFEGGETTFPDHGLTVTPRAGDALLFRNILSDGRPDPRKRHAGRPVTRGVKWLATRWIRARAFDPWTGPER
ncbi:MAG: 2OG-Fe(II) oxygenase, partial [Sphingomonas sp.]